MLGQYNYTEILQSYAEFLYAGKAKKNTVKSYLSDIRHFLGWYQTYFMKSYYISGRASLNNDGFMLNPYFETYIHIINTYHDYLTNSVEKTTKRRRLYSLRKFVQFCLKVKLIYPIFEAKLLNYFEQILHINSSSIKELNINQTFKNTTASQFITF